MPSSWEGIPCFGYSGPQAVSDIGHCGVVAGTPTPSTEPESRQPGTVTPPDKHCGSVQRRDSKV